MPKRQDISSVLVIGSGPIVIGQACEFDYSGVQACRVLRAEGIRVVLANSNPATIMTDPEFADATYIEPLDVEILEKIIAKERPSALLATLGGQTALNLAIALFEKGILDRYNVEMIGANETSIKTAENREMFKVAMGEIGLATPRSHLAHSYEEALDIVSELGFPIMLRPSFILGGAGTGICKDKETFSEMVRAGLQASPVHEVLVEESIEGWKEFELELMRDKADNCVVICSIENFDPMGVHTGDSITVAPAQTLSDVEYQMMRDAAFRVIRRIGVETGGSNIQFAVNPKDGRMVVIEMNPRVSRSSALASKATGFPIAKIATKLALGYLLDEVQNDITRVTPASFEPTIDYVVTKVPRWVFEKFPGAIDRLGTSMQSVGEVMGVGRNFCESLQKALRSIERGRDGLNADPFELHYDEVNTVQLLEEVTVPTSDRIFKLESLLRRGCRTSELSDRTGIDPWFLNQIGRVSHFRNQLSARLSRDGAYALSDDELYAGKRLGFSDAQLAYISGLSETEILKRRRRMKLVTTYKAVDTCAAEFEAFTPYFYSTYESETEVVPSEAKKIIILGSGPNRIGQGLEFDYCCVHASFALREAGYETVMINCNPETVSTDYDTSSRLYVEPLTKEAVNDVIETESQSGQLVGVVVSFGGQTPLRLAADIDPALVLGTSPASIDLAEDRERWNDLCARLNIPQPRGATVHTVKEAKEVVARIGFPVLLRPSYVLGGRAMEIVYDDAQLEASFEHLATLSDEGTRSQSGPILVDKFLEDAIEVDVDAVRDLDGDFFIGGIMEHVEEAGVHSGDSACALPPQTLSGETLAVIEEYSKALADELNVVGLINIQFAVKAGQVFVIEANPRASRTVPFVAKATAVPLAKVASLVMVGERLETLRAKGTLGTGERLAHVAVKEAVLPFNRFPDADTLLGPEMRSTGEVMGIDRSFPLAFLKSQLGAGTRLPLFGTVFLSLADRDKVAGAELAQGFQRLGYEICATQGTAEHLRRNGVDVDLEVAKVSEERSASDGQQTLREFEEFDGRIDAVRLISSGRVSLVINTPRGSGPRADGYRIRSAAQRHLVPALTTISAAKAALLALGELRGKELEVRSIQEFHKALQGT